MKKLTVIALIFSALLSSVLTGCTETLDDLNSYCCIDKPVVANLNTNDSSGLIKFEFTFIHDKKNVSGNEITVQYSKGSSKKGLIEATVRRTIEDESNNLTKIYPGNHIFYWDTQKDLPLANGSYTLWVTPSPDLSVCADCFVGDSTYISGLNNQTQ